MRRTIAGAAVIIAFAGAPTGAAPPPTYAATPAQTFAPAPYPREMDLPQSNYVEHCGGCHGIQGDAAPANLPTLRGRVGWFMCTPEARTYLMHLPNIARSRLTDNQDLADLLNFMVFGLGGNSVPANAVPFTSAEVARERAFPLNGESLAKTRTAVVNTLIKRCGAPASLRLMYPGQRPAKGL